MASTDCLQTFLQIHLATDASAVYNLPWLLSSLPSQPILTSPHLTKWNNRVNALVHSRDAGARWAGLCLALQTSRTARAVLISSAQGWVTTVLPMLSRNESQIVWKASIRLLSYIFTTTMDLAEFQRQVVTPNVPKFSSALMVLAEKQYDEELKVICFDVLSIMIPLYPTLHRPIHSALSTLSLSFLYGSPTQTPITIVESVSRLHACLYAVGGKVGGAALWKKSVDETALFCTSALGALRTSYASEGLHVLINHTQLDSSVVVPLNLDRLRCGVELLCCLLRTNTPRPVPVPIKLLVNLCIDILDTTGWKSSLDIDSSIRTMEAAAVPRILEIGCRLTACVARCIQHRLAPHFAKLFSIVTHHLEQQTPSAQRLSFIKLLPSLLGSCLPPSDPLLVGRAVKAILPFIATLLSQKADGDQSTSTNVGGKRGKKRARAFEGDEVFKVGKEVMCDGAHDGESILAALDSLPFLLRAPDLPAYLYSLSSRILLSILIALPELPASFVSRDPNLKDAILRRVTSLCVELAAGSTSVLCKSLPLVIDAVNKNARDCDQDDMAKKNGFAVDLMLHPRVPPLLRSLPAVDAIALSFTESKDERTTRVSMGLRGMDDDMDVDVDVDVDVDDNRQSTGSMVGQRGASVPSIPTFSPGNEIPPSANHPAMSVGAATSTIPPTQPTFSPPVAKITEAPPVSVATTVIEVGPIFQREPPSVAAQSEPTAPIQPAASSHLIAASRSTQTRHSTSAESAPPGSGEDLEIPELNMESDTESEVE